jgi:PKD repeat protein
MLNNVPMKFYGLRFGILVLLVFSEMLLCNSISAANVKANFTVTVNPIDTSISIKNKSSAKALLFTIYFGDGTIQSGNQKVDYSHTYSQYGTYDICLFVYDTIKGVPEKDSLCETVELNPMPVCTIDFTTDITDLKVSFKGLYSGTKSKILWDFGDGATGRNLKTSHKYRVPGSYNISLYIYDKKNGCEARQAKNIMVIGDSSSCISFFTYNMSSPRTISFVNQSFGKNLIFQWNLGDGSISNDTNPVHLYKNPGKYNVVLKIQDNVNMSKSTYNTRIPVDVENIDILPDFDALVDSSSDTAEFKNNSIGSDIREYLWNFGDGITSSDTSPVHVYSTYGEYSVCLSAFSLSGNKFNTICRNIPVGTGQTLTPDVSTIVTENRTVSFITQFNQIPDSLKWDFGDGNFSQDTQPVHSFSDSSIYLVSLKFSYNLQVYEKLKIINLTSNPSKLLGRFKLNNLSKVSGLKAGSKKVRFKGCLSGDVSRLRFVWDFGDGSYDSTTLDPEHNYLNDGSYLACFKVYNYLTADSDSYCETVDVGTGINREFKVNSDIFSVFPNPTDGNISLRISVNRVESVNISIFDISGRIVSKLFSGQVLPGNFIMKKRLSLTSGMYILRFQSQSGIANQRILLK